MTGPEHYRTAEQLLDDADAWLDADTGWKAYLDTSERLQRRAADLSAAQVHATLALAAAAATQPSEQAFWLHDRSAWEAAVLPSDLQWVCDGCDTAMTTAPGGRVPDPPVCDTCWRAGTRDTRKSA